MERSLTLTDATGPGRGASADDGTGEDTLGRRLRDATTGRPDTPLVLAGNFEVENAWATGQARLPSVSATMGTAIVNRMDELALWLGTGRDLVLLKSEPDPGFVQHVASLVRDVPAVHVVASPQPERSVTTDASLDPLTTAVLAEWAARGARLLPHGTSSVEQDLAERAGIPLATPDAATCRAVNSKVFSRRLAERERIRQPEGTGCTTTAELEDAFDRAHEWLRTGPVVVKEAYGVSGKGMVVVTTTDRLARVRRLVEREAARGRQVDFTVERWVDGCVDLNYQLTVDRAGRTTLDTVKIALTEGGTHRGHRMPARLDPAHRDEIEHAAERVGAELFAHGYTGVVGIDALIERNGQLNPVIEINARNNMSTYQLRIQDRLVGAGRHALARHYSVRLSSPVTFDRVAAALGDLLVDDVGRSGAVVQGFAPVNAAFSTGVATPTEPRPGRLYVVVIGDDRDEVDRIDATATRRLARLQESA